MINEAFNKKHKSIYQWHIGGTNLFNSSKDFSDRYSCTNATVTTIMIAYKRTYRTFKLDNTYQNS